MAVGVAGNAGGSVRAAALVAIFGRALGRFPSRRCSLSWSFAAALRHALAAQGHAASAGVIELHDEGAIYTRKSRPERRRRSRARQLAWGWDPIAILTAFKAVTLEGLRSS